MFLLFLPLTMLFMVLAFHNLNIKQYGASMLFIFVALFFAICLNGVI